jgi:heme exporter protein C
VTLRILLFLWIAGWWMAGTLWTPPAQELGATVRVLYLHVPCAWITVVAMAWSMGHSIAYLRTRRIAHDDHAAAAAEIGVLFCLGATVSGAIWAKAKWGTYWNWDPRETSVFFLLLIYGAYLALRSAIDDERKRARLSAVYSAVAFVSVPFLIFIVPRIMFSLHPENIIDTKGEGGLDGPYKVVFMMMLVGFTALYFWMQSLRVRLSRLERARLEASSAA